MISFTEWFKGPPQPIKMDAPQHGEPLWTLEAGVDVVRALQPALKPLGYHVALAGGTLNKGRSDKDLDLVMLPLLGKQQRSWPPLPPLMDYLTAVLGPAERLDKPENAEYHTVSNYLRCYRCMWKFPFRGGRRIDVFIV